MTIKYHSHNKCLGSKIVIPRNHAELVIIKLLGYFAGCDIHNQIRQA